MSGPEICSTKLGPTRLNPFPKGGDIDTTYGQFDDERNDDHVHDRVDTFALMILTAVIVQAVVQVKLLGEVRKLHSTANTTGRKEASSQTMPKKHFSLNGLRKMDWQSVNTIVVVGVFFFLMMRVVPACEAVAEWDVA